MNATLKNGLMAGILSAVIYVACHFLMFDLTQSWSFGLILGIVFPVIFMVLAVKAERESQEGFISFGEALKTSFLVFMICAIIVAIAQFGLFQTFDDDTWNRIVEIQTENMKGIMEMVGGDEIAMDNAMQELTVDTIKESMSGVGAMMMNLLGNALFGLLISLVVSAIMKRNPTP